MDNAISLIASHVKERSPFLLLKHVDRRHSFNKLSPLGPVSARSFSALYPLVQKLNCKVVLGAKFPCRSTKPLSSEWSSLPNYFMWIIAESYEVEVPSAELEPRKEKKIGPLSLTPSSSVVRDAIKRILEKSNSKLIDKIVASQVFKLDKPISQLNLNSSFPQIYSIHGGYPFAFQFGNENLFLGSSPEHLAIYKNGDLTVPSIAGTVEFNGSENAARNSLLKNPRLVREQQIVISFISATLQKFSPQIKVEGPSIASNGNLRHLSSQVTAQKIGLKDVFSALDFLHPTPALSGYPQSSALEFLEHTEPYNRGLYASPIGILDLAQNKMELLIGIRSALLTSEASYYFAGAGVLADSDPIEEENEISRKAQLLFKKLLFNRIVD